MCPSLFANGFQNYIVPNRARFTVGGTAAVKARSFNDRPGKKLYRGSRFTVGGTAAVKARSFNDRSGRKVFSCWRLASLPLVFVATSLRLPLRPDARKAGNRHQLKKGIPTT